MKYFHLMEDVDKCILATKRPEFSASRNDNTTSCIAQVIVEDKKGKEPEGRHSEIPSYEDLRLVCSNQGLKVCSDPEDGNYVSEFSFSKIGTTQDLPVCGTLVLPTRAKERLQKELSEWFIHNSHTLYLD